MEQKYDVNDFYMIEYVCSKCGNICSRNDDCCTVWKNRARETLYSGCLLTLLDTKKRATKVAI